MGESTHGPSRKAFQSCGEKGDLAALLAYLEDEKVRSSARLRRSLVFTIARMRAGGVDVPLTAHFDGREPGDPNAVQALTALVKSDSDAAVRRSAVAGLRNSADRAAVPGLLTALEDPDAAAPFHAIYGLGDLRARGRDLSGRYATPRWVGLLRRL